LTFLGAKPASRVSGVEELPGKSNYFVGSDPTKWRTNVPTFAKVKYEGIYPGVDLLYYGNQQQLEYDFVVAPGADPRRIQFKIRGAKRVRLGADGDLVLRMNENEIRLHRPVVYQERDGLRQRIPGRFTLTRTDQVGFDIGKYDPERPLILDPVLSYSTYLGGSSGDFAFGVAVDSYCNAYVTGIAGQNFPTLNPFQSNVLSQGIFATKLDATGSALIYSTYLGEGASPQRIAVDSSGDAYVTGSTGDGFPMMNALQPVYGGGGDAFVTELKPSGSALIYSTYLGGSDGTKPMALPWTV
jgi:Beta-propeller repeat